MTLKELNERLDHLRDRVEGDRYRIDSIAKGRRDGGCENEEYEDWAAIVRVRMPHGWDGKVTWRALIEQAGMGQNPDQIVQMCKVPKGRRLGVTTID